MNLYGLQVSLAILVLFLYGAEVLTGDHLQKALEQAREALEQEDPEQLLQGLLEYEEQAGDTGVTVVNLIESFNLPKQE